MELELWSNYEDEFGYIADESNLKKRVFLENHVIIEGIDVSDIEILNNLYIIEFRKNKDLDSMDFLINLSRNWFSLKSYLNRYIELSDSIVFNINRNNFESLIDTYSSSAERYIESYDEENSLVIYGEFDFQLRRKINTEEKGCAIKVEDYKEEHLYKIKEYDAYLYLKSYLSTDVRKGMIISKSAANYLLNNNDCIMH